MLLIKDKLNHGNYHRAQTTLTYSISERGERMRDRYFIASLEYQENELSVKEARELRQLEQALLEQQIQRYHQKEKR